MNTRKLFILGLTVSLLNFTVFPCHALGDGVNATKQEEEGYAKREAVAKSQLEFGGTGRSSAGGGDTATVTIGIILIIVVVTAIIFLIPDLIMSSPPKSKTDSSKPKTEALPPASMDPTLGANYP